MRTFAKFSNVNKDHAVRYSHKYDVTSAVPVTKNVQEMPTILAFSRFPDH